MTLDEAIKQFESVRLYKNFEEFIEDCGDSRVKDGVKICGNPVNSLLFRGYGICDEDHCPDYKKCVERAEEHRQLTEWLKELKRLRKQTWSFDDAREDFMYDVYKTLESLPTNDEANKIIDSFDRVTSGIRQELYTITEFADRCRECGAKYGKSLKREFILDKIKAEIEGKYRVILKGTPKDDWAVIWNECIDDVLEIIDKYKAESEG